MYFHDSVIQKGVSQGLEITTFSLKIGGIKLLGNSLKFEIKTLLNPHMPVLYIYLIYISVGYCYNQVYCKCALTLKHSTLRAGYPLLTVLAVCCPGSGIYKNLFCSFYSISYRDWCQYTHSLGCCHGCKHHGCPNFGAQLWIFVWLRSLDTKQKANFIQKLNELGIPSLQKDK